MGLWFAGSAFLAAIAVAIAGWIARRRGRPFAPWRIAGWVMTIVGVVAGLSVILLIDFLPVLLAGVVLLLVSYCRPAPAR